MVRIALVVAAFLALPISSSAQGLDADALRAKIERLQKQRNALLSQAEEYNARAEQAYEQAQAKADEMEPLQAKLDVIEAARRQIEEIDNPSVRMGDPIILGPTVKGEPGIQDPNIRYWAELLGLQERITSCFTERGEAGKLVMKFVVSPEGDVTSCARKSAVYVTSLVADCICDLVSGTTFSKTDDLSIINQPFIFGE